MDTTQTLVDATRRYLAGTLSLPELADIEASLVHLWPQLPGEDLVSRLMGAIEQGLAFMDDGVGTADDLRATLERELVVGGISKAPPVDLAAVSYSHYKHHPLRLLHPVDGSVSADAKPEQPRAT